jgi:hypothetical protein
MLEFFDESAPTPVSGGGPRHHSGTRAPTQSATNTTDAARGAEPPNLCTELYLTKKALAASEARVQDLEAALRRVASLGGRGPLSMHTP